jgi:PAS domain S-box-containing protein
VFLCGLYYFKAIGGFLMNKKPTYEEVEQVFRKLEEETKMRQKAEKALQKSEEMYRDLFENSPNAFFFISGEDGSILKCNTTSTKLLGYDRAALMGMEVFDLYADTPYGISKAQNVFKRFKKGESIRDVELQMRHKDGFPIWVSLSVEPVKDHNGNINESRSVVIDISERKRSEEVLKERVKELNCLYGISHLVEKRGISLEEITQGTVDLIPSSWQHPEITCARIIMGDQEFKTKNFRKTDWKQACDIIVHGESSGTVEVYYLEGKPACHEGPFLKEERTLIKAIAQRLGRIVERKRAEKELRCLKEKFEDLYHNAPIMYLSLDSNGIIIECNNAILDKLEFTKREIIGKHMTTFLTEESIASFKEDFPELIKTGKLMGVERQLITKSGKIIDVQLSVSGEYDEHGKLIKTRASFEDISGLKRAEEHIHSLTHALINAHESERRMISRELHDRIAQDLSTLKIGFDTLLYNQAAVSLEESQKAAEFSEIFKNTIAAVRDLSYDLRPPLLDEMGLVEAISNFCESFYGAHGVNVHFIAAGMDNLRLNFETEINLYRLVQEGLNNIRKHAEAADAFVKLVAASPNILLRIEDNGRGFDIERRAEAVKIEKRMGLRSMEERTCLLGGKMTVKSLPLKGTKILIKIPQNQGKYGSKNNHSDR